MAWFKKNWMTLLLVLAVLVGALLLAYPSFSDWWNDVHQSRAVMDYAQSVSQMEENMYEVLLASADEYNAALRETGMRWMMDDEQREAYEKELNISEAGIMAYISIPKISVTLPIYHGTSEAVLQKAIGHLEGSSLPVGGESTHCVVSGHRGMPSAKLFTDLDKIVEGDTWTITVLNRTITYEADQIRIVDPTNLTSLKIEEGKDYCTLVTCTPYGINTHRLLVRGHRVENAQGEAQITPDAIQVDPRLVAPFVAGPVIVLMFIFAMILPNRKRRYE